MAREDGVGCSDDNELEIEEADSQPARATSTRPASPATAHKKQLYDRSKRKDSTVKALNGTTAPVPTPRVLTKAAESTPIDVPISAKHFRATKQRWTGVNQPLEHPLLAHANNPEVLKRHMQYIDWQGNTKSHVVLDRAGHIIGTLISPPVSGEEWASVVSVATDAIRAAQEKMTFPATAFHHRRVPAEGEGFPTMAKGFLYGGSRQYVGNIKPSSQQNARALDELITDPSITRFVTYPIRQ
ncbi:hypothetical protein B0H14DRAFT_3521796 [Mycena olivaceomarginata]|nr:hypothetical protein B0H14DRAFT_3521796 [Mycena olivaceomarginata]